MKKIIIFSLLVLGVLYLKKHSDQSDQKEQNNAIIAQAEPFKDKHIQFSEKHFANHA